MNTAALSQEVFLTDSSKTTPHVLSLEDAIIEADNFLRLEIPVKQEILSPWLSEQSIVLVSGWRGAGKSWFGLSVFDAISKGKPFGPWKTVNPVPALYLEAEMPASDIQERLKALGEGERKAPLHIYSDAHANGLGLQQANILRPEWREEIEGLLIKKEVKLFGLDNLSSLSPGIDENQKQDWDPINQWLINLRHKGISTVMFHHFNKVGGQRGTSAREDNIDISLHLVQPDDYTPEDGARFIVKFSKARIRTADLPSLEDMEFRMRENGGRVEWTFNSVKKKNKAEVLRLLTQGIRQEEIAVTLDIGPPQVSKIKKALINEGYLKDGKITPLGSRFLEEN
jgi:RecA-family ATPase